MLYGLLLGCMIPIIITILNITLSSAPLTVKSILWIQVNQPLHWIIITAPIILGFIAGLLGKYQDQIIKLQALLGCNDGDLEYMFVESNNYEKKLREREEKYRKLFQHSHDAIIIHDLEGNIIDFNQKALKQLNYHKSELSNLRITDLHPKESLKKAQWAFDKIKRYEYVNFNIDFKKKSGEIFPAEVSSSIYTIGQKKIIQGIVRDISEQQKAEKEQIKLAEVVRHSSELVNLATMDGRMIFLNDAGSKMLGIDPGEIHRINIMDVIPDHLMSLVENELLPAITNGNPWKGDLQYKNLTTGELTDVHAMTFTINDPKTGQPQFLANVSLDITDRKEAEEILKKNEQEFKSIFESFLDLYYETDMSGNVTVVSPSCLRLSGYKPEEILGRQVTDFYPFPEQRLYLLKTLLKVGYVNDYELILKGKSGKEIPVSVNSRIIMDDQNKPIKIAGTIRDITDRSQVQIQLQQSEKKYRDLIENISDGVITADLDENILFVNKASNKILGYNSNELIGMDFRNLVVTEERDIVKRETQKRKSKEYSQYELRLVNKDGQCHLQVCREIRGAELELISLGVLVFLFRFL